MPEGRHAAGSACDRRGLATIADPRLIARILAPLGLPVEPPRPGPPRHASWLPADAN